MQNGSSVGIYVHNAYTFCTFGADLYAQSVLFNQISASELSQNFLKSALLVGRHVLAKQIGFGRDEDKFKKWAENECVAFLGKSVDWATQENKLLFFSPEKKVF